MHSVRTARAGVNAVLDVDDHPEPEPEGRGLRTQSAAIRSSVREPVLPGGWCSNGRASSVTEGS